MGWRFRHAACNGDVIAGAVEVLSLRDDKPLVELRTTVTTQDGVLFLHGTALVYRRHIA